MILNDTLRDFMRGSKAVDAQGDPIRLYHGTNADVPLFDGQRSNSKSKTGAPANSFFFSDSPEVAGSYTVEWQGDFSQRLHDGANVMPVYLSIKKPLKVSAKGESWSDFEYKGEFISINDLVSLAQESGRYDGVIVTRVKDKGVGFVENRIATTYVAFDPAQIKSAIGTNDFDSRSPYLTSLSPSEQAVQSFRYCARATGRYDFKADPDLREPARYQELLVYLGAMEPSERRDFLVTEIKSVKGWFQGMTEDYVDSILTVGMNSALPELYRDLGPDWSLPGFGHAAASPVLADLGQLAQISNARLSAPASRNDQQHAFGF